MSAAVSKEAALEALRTRAAAAKAAREKTPAERLDAEIAAATIQAANEEAITAAVAEHGDIGVNLGTVETRLGVVILKRPKPGIWKKFADKGDTKSATIDSLVRPCVVYPSLAEFDAILDAVPAALIACGDMVALLAGVRDKEAAEK